MSKPKQENVRVGVGVLVKDPADGRKIFCGIRKGSHGAGSLALPGGHLEMMESWEECASREIKEEMDIDLTNLRFAHVTNDVMATEEKHYVTIFMMGEFKDPSAIPRNMEPHKCEGWKSFSWEELKEIRNRDDPNLFGPMAKLVDDSPVSVEQFLLHK
jgi:8-oxo-dGTP diphosphatase